MSLPQCYLMNMKRIVSHGTENDAKPAVSKEKVMSYEEKSVGSTSFFKCEACPYMALAEDDIKFHLFTEHPDLARTNGLADNIQIPCPGCTSIFVTEETLRTHLRNHHKMGIKDVKKMVKSLINIALKDAKLKKEDKMEEPPATLPTTHKNDATTPQLIEIAPDNASACSETLPKGMAFISVDELQKMSTPNFEKVDPKEIIQEASINIVYSNEISHQYINVTDHTTSNNPPMNLMKMSSVTPDLISSIQPRVPILDTTKNTSPLAVQTEPIPLTIPHLPKLGRPKGSKTIRSSIKDESSKEVNIEKNFGKLCSVDGCHSRLKDPEKLTYHRKCHQNGQLHCPECGQMLLDVMTLHTHLWKIHSMDMELPTCEICGYKTYKKHTLYNIHMKCHEVGTYPCPTCSKIFKSTNQLNRHCLSHQTKEPEVFRCTICQLEFKSQRNLKFHITQVHKKMKPFKCNHCEYTAARKQELKLHLRSHNGDKPYSCNICKYRSGDHNALRRHKKQHSRETTYRCKYCPYSAIQSTVFASHMISKHPKINSEDVHCCPYCPFKSVNREKYVVHLANHPDEKGVQLLIEMKSSSKTAKPSWTIPSEDAKENTGDANVTADKVPSPKKVNDVPIEVYDCDSQHDSMKQRYPENYSTRTTDDAQKANFNDRVLLTDLSKEDINSDCLISESSNDTMIERHQYPPQHRLQDIPFNGTQTNLHFLDTAVSLEQSILQNSNVNSLVTNHMPSDAGMCNNMSNFPIRLTLKPVDKIFPMTKVTGPIIKPTQILPVPSSSNSPINTTTESEGGPRKKPKISVKSNLILKGPDQVNMFHSQQKMAFKRLEDNERYGLGPVTFNNLITTQFMQLPPEQSESPNNILLYSQESLEVATPPVDAPMSDTTQMFTFNQQLTGSMSIMPPQTKIQTSDPSYIKLEGTIKQNTQSPSLERMCSANVIQNITREYKASPPLEDIHKNISEIKNEVKSDYYNIPLSSGEPTAGMMDQYLMDNMIGEQFAAHLDLSGIVLPLVAEERQNDGDVIEIDDNSDDTKMLPRFDMNFPLESMYLMHNDFHFLDNEVPSSEVSVNEMNRMVTEVPIVNQKENIDSDVQTDFPNFIQGKKDPMMNTSVRLSTNKINVKNIESMKN